MLSGREFVKRLSLVTDISTTSGKAMMMMMMMRTMMTMMMTVLMIANYDDS